jgi:hypothetical protein
MSVTLDDMVGRTIDVFTVISDQEAQIEMVDGKIVRLWHEPVGTEIVFIDEIEGNLNRIKGRPITVAEDRSADAPPERSSRDDRTEGPFTWTWYYLSAGGNRDVTVKFYGMSDDGANEKPRTSIGVV